MMAEIKKAGVKSKVEAVLFSVGRKISLDEICKLCRSRKEDVLQALQELQKEYDEKQSSLMLVEENDSWKFAVRDHLISVIRKIVTETELSKSVLETLAVIAFKYPILQSDLIKLRTNKAYDHLAELEKAGYISRQKHGRTNLIKLTEKFFRYFDLTEEKLKDQFKDFDSIARAIREKEEEVEKIVEEQKKRAEDLKKEDEKIKAEIESLDKAEEDFTVPLETYPSPPREIISEEFARQDNLIIEKEKIGELEVVEEQNQQIEKEKAVKIKQHSSNPEQLSPIIAAKDIAEEAKHPEEKKEQQPETLSAPQDESKEHNIAQQPKKRSKGIKMTPELKVRVEKRVEEILHGEENKEDKKESKEASQQ